MVQFDKPFPEEIKSARICDTKELFLMQPWRIGIHVLIQHSYHLAF